MTKRVEYHSNNSGGDWWLSDANWKALEKGGWKVDWFKDEPFYQGGDKPVKRWLGALARSASKECDSVDEAVSDWERIVKQDADAEGCPCCGRPHDFYLREEGGAK